MKIIDEEYVLQLLKKRNYNSEELCSILKKRPEQIRGFVNKERQKGIPICSDRNGYWLSDNCEEINKTINSLQNRVKNMQNAINGLKNCLKEMEQDGNSND